MLKRTGSFLVLLALMFFTVPGAWASAEKYDIVVAADGSGNYTTVQAAIDAVPHGRNERTYIYIKNGVYHEKVIVPSSKINITLIGESLDKTIITNSDYNPKVIGKDTINTWTSYTFAVDADGFQAEKITFENAAGRVGQGVAVRVMADQVIFTHCRFLGNQDTLFAHGVGRMWFRDCYIEGTTDFIFGSAVALFENCEIKSLTNSYITAASTPMGNPYGFVFKDCNLTAADGVTKVFLGRPWRAYAKTVFINCTMGKHILPEGWNNWRSTEKEKTAYYAEFGSKGPGTNNEARAAWAKQLTPADTASYATNKIFERGSVPIPVVGSWMPAE